MCRQCISSTPAPNQTSHSEKNITVHEHGLLLWTLGKSVEEQDPSSPVKRHPVIAHYLGLSEECLGGDDVDYTEHMACLAMGAGSSHPNSSLPGTPVGARGGEKNKGPPGSATTMLSARKGSVKRKGMDGGGDAGGGVKSRRKSSVGGGGGGQGLANKAKTKGKKSRGGGKSGAKKKKVLQDDGRGDTTTESEDDHDDGSGSDFM